jgi:hypothetical protein
MKTGTLCSVTVNPCCVLEITPALPSTSLMLGTNRSGRGAVGIVVELGVGVLSLCLPCSKSRCFNSNAGRLYQQKRTTIEKSEGYNKAIGTRSTDSRAESVRSVTDSLLLPLQVVRRSLTRDCFRSTLVMPERQGMLMCFYP